MNNGRRICYRISSNVDRQTLEQEMLEDGLDQRDVEMVLKILEEHKIRNMEESGNEL